MYVYACMCVCPLANYRTKLCESGPHLSRGLLVFSCSFFGQCLALITLILSRLYKCKWACWHARKQNAQRNYTLIHTQAQLCTNELTSAHTFTSTHKRTCTHFTHGMRHKITHHTRTRTLTHSHIRTHTYIYRPGSAAAGLCHVCVDLSILGLT